MRASLFAAAVGIFLLLPASASAQQPEWQLGPVAGWLFGQPTAIDRSSPNIHSFGTNGEGKSWENSAVGGLRLDLPISTDYSIAFKLAFSQTHGEFKSKYYVDTLAVVRFFRLIEDVDAVHLSAEWHYPFSRHAYAGVGLGAQYRVSTNALERTEPVDLPLSFDTVASGSAITTSPFTLHLPISLGLRIDAASWLTIAPELNGVVDLSELARGGSSTALRGGASISLLVHPSNDTVAAPPPPITVTEPEPETIVKLHFTDEGIATNRIVASTADTTITRYIELPTRITRTPQQLEIQLSTSIDSFDLAGFNRKPASYAYQHVFDVIAARLKHDPGISLAITLIGESSETSRTKEILSNFFKRAQVERSVSIGTRTKRSRDVSIQFDSASAAISPVIGAWNERSYILPSMSLEKFIASPRGVRSWQITLSEDGKILKRWSSEDGPQAIIFPPLTLSAHRLLGRLDVTDTSGRSFLDYDSLVVDLPNEVLDTAAVDRTDFVLLPASIRSTTWHDLVMDALQSKMTTRGRYYSVTVAPISEVSTHTDAIAQEVLDRLPQAYHEFKTVASHAEGSESPYSIESYLITVRPIK